MIKKAILLGAGVTLAAVPVGAQIVTNGDFNQGGTGWTVWNAHPVQSLAVDFAASANLPDGATAPAVALTKSPSFGNENTGIYQAITLTGGNAYSFDGLTRDNGTYQSGPDDGWCCGIWNEIWIGKTEPVNGTDYTSAVGGVNVGKTNTWCGAFWNTDFASACETPAEGVFTIPGTGAQTWYLLIKVGTNNFDIPVNVVMDNIVVTDLGAGVVYDEPPTPFVEDFNDGDDLNNYGGEYRGFGGSENGAWSDGSISCLSADALGLTGQAGDRGLQVLSTPATLPNGGGWGYFGGVISLGPDENRPQDLTGFDVLEFDAALGTPTAFNQWAVRFEDTDGGQEWMNEAVRLDGIEEPALTASYQRYSIPLGDFIDGGGQVVDFTKAKVLVFVDRDNGTTVPTSEVNLLLDNVVIRSTASAGDWTQYD